MWPVTPWIWTIEVLCNRLTDKYYNKVQNVLLTEYLLFKFDIVIRCDIKYKC